MLASQRSCSAARSLGMGMGQLDWAMTISSYNLLDVKEKANIASLLADTHQKLTEWVKPVKPKLIFSRLDSLESILNKAFTPRAPSTSYSCPITNLYTNISILGTEFDSSTATTIESSTSSSVGFREGISKDDHHQSRDSHGSNSNSNSNSSSNSNSNSSSSSNSRVGSREEGLKSSTRENSKGRNLRAT
ncbi:hypothetical protein QR685DRAFT_546011 [Neurospora intermedia]|uniref:Uncharacterized protein n=1 Tax=Neurospora intermedia TaxID=5142 RepID=A0ABR3D8Q1_NEUIN